MFFWICCPFVSPLADENACLTTHAEKKTIKVTIK